MDQPSIDDIWSDDLLDRKADATFLSDFLVERMRERAKVGNTGSYVLNVEAEWGFGKTFFVQRFARQLQAQGHPVVLIDAWKNDFSDDPYTNVLAEIEAYLDTFIDEKEGGQSALAKTYDAVKKNAGKILWLGLKGGLRRGSRWLIAEGADEIIEVVDKHIATTGDFGKEVSDDLETQAIEVTDGIIDAYAEKRIKDFEEAKLSLERFRQSMGDLLRMLEANSDQKLPFFVLVDELDRCRPTYAIAMLERIKHLFDVDNVVFVLSTDTTQLAHSINGVYGQSFDSRRYLQRFFSRTYMLPKPSPRGLIDTILDKSGADEGKWQAPGVDNDVRDFLAQASSRYGMSIRDIEQAIDILLSLTTVWKYNFPIQLLVMYPMILGYITAKDIDSLEDQSWVLKSAETSLADWKLTDSGTTRGYRQFRQENPVVQYMRATLIAARYPMRNLLNRDRDYDRDEAPNFVGLWLEQVFNDEYAERFSNYVRDDEYSVIRSYPTLIKHAGRLSI